MQNPKFQTVNGVSIEGLNGTITLTFGATVLTFPATGTPVLLGGAGGTPQSIVLTNATSIPAGQLTGSVADARLSANVPLKNAANTFSEAETLSKAGAASVPALFLSGAIYAAGTGTTNFPHLFIQPTGATAATTWSTAGTPVGINMPTGFTGNFVDFKLAGAATSAFKVASTGTITAPAITTNTGNVFILTAITYAQLLPKILVGTQTAPTALIEAQGTTEQVRLRYDASNLSGFTVGSTGLLSIVQTGSAAGVSISGTLAIGGGTAIAKSSTFTKAVSALVAAGAIQSEAITATGIVAGDVVSQVEMTAIQPTSVVIQSVRCGTNTITVDFYNADLLAPHSLTGTIKVRSFKA